MYFIDESNQIWWFNGSKLKYVCKADSIITTTCIDTIYAKIKDTQFRLIEDSTMDKIIDNSIIEDCQFVPIFYKDNKEYCNIVIENGLYVINFGSEIYEIYPSTCYTDIDASKYIIYKTTCKFYENDESCKYKIFYVEKSNDSNNLKIYQGIYDNDEYKYKKTKYINIGKCDYKIGGYVNNGNKITSLISNKKYDAIYPNLFDSIARIGDNYYIQHVKINVDNFDFGNINVKSARNI